jgi:hypothetical protein
MAQALAEESAIADATARLPVVLVRVMVTALPARGVPPEYRRFLRAQALGSAGTTSHCG